MIINRESDSNSKCLLFNNYYNISAYLIENFRHHVMIWAIFSHRFQILKSHRTPINNNINYKHKKQNYYHYHCYNIHVYIYIHTCTRAVHSQDVVALGIAHTHSLAANDFSHQKKYTPATRFIFSMLSLFCINNNLYCNIYIIYIGVYNIILLYIYSILVDIDHVINKSIEQILLFVRQ